MFLAGVLPGTTLANGMASSYRNAPRGSDSVILIVPFASSVTMPVTPPFLVLRKSSPPLMVV